MLDQLVAYEEAARISSEMLRLLTLPRKNYGRRSRKQSKRAAFAAQRKRSRHASVRLTLAVPTREQMVEIINAAEAAGCRDAVERLAERYAGMWR